MFWFAPFARISIAFEFTLNINNHSPSDTFPSAGRVTVEPADATLRYT